MKFEIEKPCGSDPTFEKEQVELDRPSKINALAFCRTGAGSWALVNEKKPCPALARRASALVPSLDKETFSDGIVNDLGIHNREDDAHSIENYLSDFAIAQRVHAALA